MKRNLKKAISALLVAGMLTGTMAPVSVAAADVDLTENLIAHYDFEDASGTTVPNVCGDAYTGTITGSNVTITEEEDWGKVLNFASGADGCLSVPSIVNTGAKSYSMSMWYKLANTSGRSQNVALFQQTGSGRSLLLLTPTNVYRSYVNGQNADGTNAVDLSNWQHVTYVYDSDSNEVSFYINGELDATVAAGSNEVNALTDLYIGRHKNTNDNTMNGMIDEVRIYEGVVSADFAKEIYLADADASEVPDEPKPEPTDDLVLTVNPDEVERTIDDATIGINHRYGFNGYGSFNSENMTMHEEFVELYKEAGFGSLRYPGGTISNLFRWKESIGDVENRVDQIHGFYNNSGQNGIAPNFGITELMEFTSEVDSEIVYVYGFGRGSAQDAADLVEYFNAPVGSNPNGGIAWAEIRKANGQEEPVNVRYFEIGNENNQGAANGDGTWSQQYWMSFVDGGAESAYINGGTAKFNRQYAVLKDNWNQAVSGSDGTANQVRYMRYANPNPMTGDGTELDDTFEAVVKGSVHVYVNGTEWAIVDSFDNQNAAAQVVTVDYRDGSFTFGDGKNGAIPSRGAAITVSYNVEKEGFVDVVRAMKSTTEQINAYYEKNGIDETVECYTYSSFESSGFITKMKNGGFNDLYDGLTIHPYSGTPTSTNSEIFYDSAMSLAESAGIGKVQNYVNMLPEDKVPVISEYGIFRSTDARVRSQTHALYIARVLMEYVRFGSPYIQKHCLIDWYSSGADSLGPTQQAVIQAVPQAGASTLTGEGEFRYFSTPSARVFEMYKEYGTEIIASEFSRMDKMSNGAKLYSALASKDAEGTVYVAVVNLDRDASKELIIDINGVNCNGVDVTIQTLAGDTIDAENTLENPNNVDIEVSKMVGTEETLTVELPAHSFNMIKIESFDNEKLQSKVTEAKEYKATDYTADSFEVLQDAIAAAEAVVNKGNASQAEIAEVYLALEEAEDNLVKLMKKSDLQAALDKYADVSVEGCTEDSAKAFTDAYKAAENVVKNANATQDDISKAYADLEKAAAGLVVDKTELDELLAEALTKKEEEYSISSWTAFAKALSTAKRVSSDKDATAAEVAEAVVKLTEALENLGEPQPAIPVSAMKVTAGDSQSGQGPENAIDGDPSTLWHTDWYNGPNYNNHWFQFELNEVYNVSTLRYLPRQSGPNGVITGYEILASMDGKDWTVVAEGTWPQDTAWKEVALEDVQAKYIRLKTTNAGSDQQIKFTSAAEIALSGTVYVACDGHVTELQNAKEATCTENGYTGDEVCTKCGVTVKKGKTIKATGHTFGEWEVVKEATATEDGLKVRKCACGEEENEVIPATGEPDPTPTPTPTPEPWVNPFKDVAEGKWYYNAVAWGAQNDVVTGLTEDTFGVDVDCTRGQIVTFIWRAMGEPEAAEKAHSFTDVEEGKYYYDAMLWAVEEGIVTGLTDTTFGPKEICTRGQMATLLYRLAGEPEVGTEIPFPDVKLGKWYTNATIWAAEEGIVTGYTDGTFGYNDTVSREQTITMLYRYFVK